MKVTAILPDNLVSEVREISGGRTITESLICALREWTSLRRIRALNRRVERSPLRFSNGYSAESARESSRRKRS